MNRTTFTLAEEPRDAVYERLLELGLIQSAALGLVVQKWRTYPRSALDVLERLSPFSIEVKEVNEWPGTRLAPGYSEELRLYRYEHRVKGLLTFASNGLFDWQNPDLPDDLHLLREDGSVWLGSIAHEEDAWLQLTHGEYAELTEVAPEVAVLLRHD